MKIMNLVQGSDAWHKHRSNHFNASDASAMMGASKYKTRNELLKEYATGARKEVDASTQRLFDKGHAAEAAARPLAEAIIGEELYPVTVSIEAHGLRLSASFDGLTMDESIAWEHKALNKDLRLMYENGLDMHYHWQLAHQMLVSGAEKVLFMATNESEQYEMWVSRDESLIASLIEGWKQFSVDVEDYQHVEVIAEPVGKVPDALPALRIEVTGMVTASNLEAFKAGADMVLGSINRDLQTDQDFAEADKAVKFCKEVEVNVQTVKKNALSQTADIDELFRALDSVAAESCKIRKELEGLIKARKENLRNEIRMEAEMAFSTHIETINARLKLVKLPIIKANFAEVMKGLKSFDSMRDKVSAELARVKIEASQLSEHIGKNLDFFVRVVQSHERHLFHDVATLVLKPQADMEAVIKTRIREESDRIDAAAQAKLEAEKAAQEKAAAAIPAEPQHNPDAPGHITAQQPAPEVTQAGIPSPKENNPVASATATLVSKRPTDKQIIFAVATQFNVDFDTARSWIAGMDTGLLSAA